MHFVVVVKSFNFFARVTYKVGSVFKNEEKIT